MTATFYVGDAIEVMGKLDGSTHMALIQLCEHGGCVAAHVVRVGDAISDVLEFFGLTFADWIVNRWRFELRSTEQVRVMEICNRHSDGERTRP